MFQNHFHKFASGNNRNELVNMMHSSGWSSNFRVASGNGSVDSNFQIGEASTGRYGIETRPRNFTYKVWKRID